jgi:hypothetical protein
MTKKETGVAVVDQKSLEALKDMYPTEQGFTRLLLPRLTMVSQDQTEGKGKAMKVVTEAGTFFTEKQSQDETENEDGKMVKEWVKDEIGDSIEGVILFQRKQLKMYDEDTEKYTSSPIYDTEDETVVLFCDKKEVARGLPKDLKAKYQYTDKAGKVKSALEDNRILYILYEAEVYQMNLRGSSMYSFLTYSRKVLPPSVLTSFSSEAKEKGEIAWNQMTFEIKCALNAKEIADVIERVAGIKEGIAMEKGYYAQQNAAKSGNEIDPDKDLKDF